MARYEEARRPSRLGSTPCLPLSPVPVYRLLPNMALLEGARGNHEAAIEWAERAVTEQPDLVINWVALAFELAAVGRSEAAAASCRRRS